MGGGIQSIDNLSAIIEENDIRENSSGVNTMTGFGGGICDLGGSTFSLIRNNVIFDNHANFSGGGISCQKNSQIILETNTLKENSAGMDSNIDIGYGGGISCFDSSVHLTNNLILENQAQYGGAASMSSSEVHYINCIFYDNDSPDDFGDGLFCSDRSFALIKNS
jgi:hypothetical protein